MRQYKSIAYNVNQNLMNSRMTGTMIFVCNGEKCVLHHNLLISVTAENQKKENRQFYHNELYFITASSLL